MDERLAYRLLTGTDDRAFCERVSAALADGYQLHGAPAVTFDGERVVGGPGPGRPAAAAHLMTYAGDLTPERGVRAGARRPGPPSWSTCGPGRVDLGRRAGPERARQGGRLRRVAALPRRRASTTASSTSCARPGCRPARPVVLALPLRGRGRRRRRGGDRGRARRRRTTCSRVSRAHGRDGRRSVAGWKICRPAVAAA